MVRLGLKHGLTSYGHIRTLGMDLLGMVILGLRDGQITT